MNIAVVGDVMPGCMLSYQDLYIDADLLSYFKGFDLRIGTLECAIGKDIPYDEEKKKSTNSIVYVREEDAGKVIKMGFDILSLANNHVTDLGILGLKNTIKYLDNNGIKHFGAGLTLEEAKRPAVIITDKGEKIAIIGCMFKGFAPTLFHVATPFTPGVYQTTIEELEEYVKELKKEYDLVFFMPHWGEEHSYLPPTYCKEYAERIIKAGADVILGDHPHIINPVITIKNAPCFFSLGNFLFPDMVLQPPRPVFYPNEEEFHKIRNKVWSYPRSVNEPTIAVWKESNRVGMVAELEIKEKIYYSYKLVRLDTHNILGFLSNTRTKTKRIRMKLYGLLVKSPYYSLLHRIYKSPKNYPRLFTHKVSKMFTGNPH